MVGLHIVVLTADAERFRGALMLAMAHRALGGTARLFFQAEAAGLLFDTQAPRDAAHEAAGLPTLAQLIDEALNEKVAVIACQTGLALVGKVAGELEGRMATGGLVSFLAEVGAADRLLTV